KLTLRIEEIEELLRKNLEGKFEDVTIFHTNNLRFLVLIGVPQVRERENAIQLLQQAVDQVRLEGLKGYSILVVVSRLYASRLKNSHLAYHDVTEGFKYRNIGARSAVVDVRAIRSVFDVYLPFGELEKLSHCLISGNALEGKELVKQMLVRNIELNVHY